MSGRSRKRRDESRFVCARLGEARYPAALHAMPNPPPVLTTSGPLVRQRAVAIVGARDAIPTSIAFAYDLAKALAQAGILVVSGGAIGVDAAAHKGAIAGGGPTWVVCGTGKNKSYPAANRDLFAKVETSADSRMIWAFTDDQPAAPENLIYRNGVLVAFCEAVVVIQARERSGSCNAMLWATDLRRPLWTMSAYPGLFAFAGSAAAIESGRARPLVSFGQLFRALELPQPEPWRHARTLGAPAGDDTVEEGKKFSRPKKNAPAPHFGTARKDVFEAPDQEDWSDEEKLVFSDLLAVPLHVDEIAGRLPLPAGSAVSALLTLSLKDVVVEGPDGFFRRRTVS